MTYSHPGGGNMTGGNMLVGHVVDDDDDVDDDDVDDDVGTKRKSLRWTMPVIAGCPFLPELPISGER